jgi:SOS response regulatory protein OraA/RecX
MKNRVEGSLEKLKASALRMISRRDHSIGEIKTKLQGRYIVTPENFALLIQYLEKYNYLVAPEILAQKLKVSYRQQGRGQFWIKGKLKQKGLGTASERVQNVEQGPEGSSEADLEIEAARLFLTKKLRTVKDANSKMTYAERSKLARKLQARGFSHDTIAKAMTLENIK